MESLYQDYSTKDVRFVFVNANFNEPAKEVADHAKEAGFTFPVPVRLVHPRVDGNLQGYLAPSDDSLLQR